MFFVWFSNPTQVSCETAVTFDMEIEQLIWSYILVLRDFTPLFSGHIEKMKYLVNTDISAMQLFDLRWNARGNIDRVLFIITEYLYKLYLDVNDGCRVLDSSCTWKVSDFRKSRCDDEFFVEQRHPTKPDHQEEKKPLQPWQFYTQTFNSLIVTLIAAIKFILLELATLCLLFRPTENKGIMGTLSNFLLCFVWFIWATENSINFGDMIAYLIPRISTHLDQWWKVNTFTPVLWMRSLWGTLNFQFPSALKGFLVPPS